MNLQSPTTLLSSIQSMRDRLRSDKQKLQDIKNQFNDISNKSRPSAIQTILQQSVQDITNNQNLSLRKNDFSIQKKQKMCLFQLKKENHKQLLKIKQQHQRQLNQMKAVFEEEKKLIQQNWKQQVDQQLKYIAILQQQVKNPTNTQRQRVSNQQYDAVINQLLQQNTRLHNNLQQARDQSENWRRKARKYINEVQSRERLKFMSKKISQSREGLILREFKSKEFKKLQKVSQFITTKTQIGQILAVIGKTAKFNMMKEVQEQLNNFHQMSMHPRRQSIYHQSFERNV